VIAQPVVYDEKRHQCCHKAVGRPRRHEAQAIHRITQLRAHSTRLESHEWVRPRLHTMPRHAPRLYSVVVFEHGLRAVADEPVQQSNKVVRGRRLGEHARQNMFENLGAN